MEQKGFEQEIDRWMQENRDSMREELTAWVSHPSVSRADLGEVGAPYGSDCRKMLDFALERGRHFGFRTEDHQGYCGDILYGDRGEEFGFVCHLDVVPPGEGWIFDPYCPVIKDGFLIGRGASDNKGAAVMVLWAFRFFKEKKIPLTKTLRLMLGCAEETGMSDFLHYRNEQGGDIPPLSIVADAAFPVCYAQKGSYNAVIRIPAGEDIVAFNAGKVRNSVPDRAEVVIRGISRGEAANALAQFSQVQVEDKEGMVHIIGSGKSGHAAFPENTLNAILVVAQALTCSGLTKQAGLSGMEAIATLFSSPYGEGMGIGFSDEQSGKLTLNAGVIARQGGDLLVSIDIRYPVSCSVRQIEKAMEERLAAWNAAVEDVETVDPYYVNPESDVVTALTEIYCEETGSDAKPYAMGGGTYSRVIPNAISYGPGFPDRRRAEFLPEGHGGAHGPDEALFLADWEKGLKIYIKTIARLAGKMV